MKNVCELGGSSLEEICMKYFSECDKVTLPPILTIRSFTSILSASVKSEEIKRNVFPFIIFSTGIASAFLNNEISSVYFSTFEELAGDIIDVII